MNTDKKLWVNGELAPHDSALLNPRDRGFTLGDGIFETIRVRQGEIIRIEQHLARLRKGAKTIGLSLPWTDSEIQQAIQETLLANQLKNAYLRLTLSRGVPTQRGLLPDEKNSRPSFIIQAESFMGYPKELYQRGMHAVTSSIRRNEYSPLANIKSLNYLDNILARREAEKKGADEAILLNTRGNIACASVANIFFVKGKTLLTPPFSEGALPGTVREYLINQIAPQYGYDIIERVIAHEELTEMDESFLTNALMGVMPLVSIDGKTFGEGKVEEITLALGALNL
ncbi:MAG: hypothetical protein HN392_05770 [Anaerolineae bacterium]|jgi:branched-chain amino acid aminotransferase|nr:hypothetical protein [Anaerolineae bacterium]MBT7073629.1 hypothetical protein [Anaerolineae bacterium]MBT7782321.1 hypothetical protein [Anaerolineae bacterium]